jgi:hypothetical protein
MIKFGDLAAKIAEQHRLKDKRDKRSFIIRNELKRKPWMDKNTYRYKN